MISNSDYKRSVEAAFLNAGFRKTAKNLRFDGEAGSLVVAVQKLEYMEQFFINVGIWLRVLGGSVPEKVEHTHLYFRLERLYPSYGDTILTGGALANEDQPAPLQQLCEILETALGPSLKLLVSNLDELRAAFAAGSLTGGLVRKEARELLQGGERPTVPGS